MSAEKQQGRAENGNAPSEFIARRKFSLHIPPTFFSSLSSRSHKQKSPPHGERQLADGGDILNQEGERWGRSPLDVVNPAWGSERKLADGVGVLAEIFGEGANRRLAALRAISRRFSKTLYFGASKAHNLEVSEGILVEEMARKAHYLALDCRRSVKPVLLTAQPWLSPEPRTGGRTERAERLFASLYAMQGVTPLPSKETSPKFLPACL